MQIQQQRLFGIHGSVPLCRINRKQDGGYSTMY